MEYAIETLVVEKYRLTKERREMTEEFLVSGAYDSHVRKKKQIQELEEAIELLTAASKGEKEHGI